MNCVSKTHYNWVPAPHEHCSLSPPPCTLLRRMSACKQIFRGSFIAYIAILQPYAAARWQWSYPLEVGAQRGGVGRARARARSPCWCASLARPPAASPAPPPCRAASPPPPCSGSSPPAIIPKPLPASPACPYLKTRNLITFCSVSDVDILGEHCMRAAKHWAHHPGRRLTIRNGRVWQKDVPARRAAAR